MSNVASSHGILSEIWLAKSLKTRITSVFQILGSGRKQGSHPQADVIGKAHVPDDTTLSRPFRKLPERVHPAVQQQLQITDLVRGQFMTYQLRCLALYLQSAKAG